MKRAVKYLGLTSVVGAASVLSAGFIVRKILDNKNEEDLLTNEGAGLPFTRAGELGVYLFSKVSVLRSLSQWKPEELSKLFNLEDELDVLTDASWYQQHKEIYESQNINFFEDWRKKMRDLQVEELKVECEMYNDKEGHFTPFGKFLMLQQRIEKLEQRNNIIQYALAHPEIVRSPPLDSRDDGKGIIAVIGQHRTGSTLLQRLLNLDPKNRSPISWHLLAMPPPFTEEKKQGLVDNIKKLDLVCPNLLDKIGEMHKFDLNAAEEDVIVLYALGLGFHEVTWFNNDKGEAWFDKNHEDIGAYRMRYLHLCLKELDSAFETKKRWVIKNPDHSNYLKKFMDEFPQAMIVYTHRNPEKIVSSLARLILTAQHAAIYDPYTKEKRRSITPEGWGDSAVRHSYYTTQRLIRDRQFLENKDPERAARQIIDISYSELVADPVGCVEKIYEKFGLEFTDEFRGKIIEYMNKPRKTGTPYSLKQFLLTPERIKSDLSDYIENFSKYF